MIICNTITDLRKWGDIVKKLFIKFTALVAMIALAVTVMAVNSACIFLAHQPELPNNSRKLRKF